MKINLPKKTAKSWQQQYNTTSENFAFQPENVLIGLLIKSLAQWNNVSVLGIRANLIVLSNSKKTLV